MTEPWDDPPLLTSEAARLLGVSPDTVRLWADGGRLPARRTATGVRLFARAVVERLAEARRQTATRARRG